MPPIEPPMQPEVEAEDFGLGTELDEALQQDFPIKTYLEPVEPSESTKPGAPRHRESYEGSKALKCRQLNEELENFATIASTLRLEIAYRQNELAEVEAVIKALTTSIECLNEGSEQKSNNPSATKTKKVGVEHANNA